MKILVFSDSHRALGTMYDAIERLRPDAVIHLGDHLEDAESMESVFSGVLFLVGVRSIPGTAKFFWQGRELQICRTMKQTQKKLTI